LFIIKRSGKNPKKKMKKRISSVRRVLKKGRYVFTKRGSFVISLSKRIYEELKPLCEKIEIVGSIRRGETDPVDIDLILIPKNKEKIVEFMKKRGRFLQGGNKRVAFKIKGVKVEIYYATQKNWGAMLMAYTGPAGYCIGLRMIAKKKGYLLNQYGLFKNKKHIAGKTEKSIYESLGKKYKSPKIRGD